MLSTAYLGSFTDVSSYLNDKKVPNAVTVATGKVSHAGTLSYLPEYEYMRTLVTKEKWGDIKLTIESPLWYNFRYGSNKACVKGVYANDDEYFADVTAAYQVELQILYNVGLQNA